MTPYSTGSHKVKFPVIETAGLGSDGRGLRRVRRRREELARRRQQRQRHRAAVDRAAHHRAGGDQAARWAGAGGGAGDGAGDPRATGAHPGASASARTNDVCVKCRESHDRKRRLNEGQRPHSPRRTRSPRNGLRSWKRKSAGVAKLPRELISHTKSIRIRAIRCTAAKTENV
jgi:hypothetical protein